MTSEEPIQTQMKLNVESVEISAEYLADEESLPRKLTTMIPDDSELSQSLPKPYKNNWRSKIYYQLQTFLVIHPRLHALWLLYLAKWPRGLVLFDMYTDIAVAINLYKDKQSLFFMLSCVLIFTPFVLVWVASLRFVQDWISKNADIIIHQK